MSRNKCWICSQICIYLYMYLYASTCHLIWCKLCTGLPGITHNAVGPVMEVPQNAWFISGKIPAIKWMMSWGFPYFRKPPNGWENISKNDSGSHWTHREETGRRVQSANAWGLPALAKTTGRTLPACTPNLMTFQCHQPPPFGFAWCVQYNTVPANIAWPLLLATKSRNSGSSRKCLPSLIDSKLMKMDPSVWT